MLICGFLFNFTLDDIGSFGKRFLPFVSTLVLGVVLANTFLFNIQTLDQKARFMF